VEDIVCALLVGRPFGKTTIRFGGTGTMEIDEIESYIEGGLEAIKGFKVPKSEEGGIVSEKQLIYIGHYTEENDREENES